MALPAVAMGIGALAGGIQALIGAGQAKRANRNLKRLFSQRKAYSTPSEIFEILELTQSNASQGFSDETMQFLEGGASRGLASTLGAATRLGADPNQISGVLDSYFQDIFRIGTENELVKMKKFDDFTNALKLVSDSRSAEWASEDNLIKDQMQAEAQKVGAGQANVQSGLNLALGAGVALLGGNMYGEQPPAGNVPTSTSARAANYTVTTPTPTVRPNLSIGNQRGNFSV